MGLFHLNLLIMKILHYFKGLLLTKASGITEHDIKSLIKDNEFFVVKPDGNVYLIPRETILVSNYVKSTKSTKI